jgi:hypothetical protein
MPRAAKKPKDPPLPSSHLEAIKAAGFDVLGWQDVAIRVLDSTGQERSEWLPCDLVHWEKRLFIRYGASRTYPEPGWEPQRGHIYGGHYSTVQDALSWFTRLEEQEKRS